MVHELLETEKSKREKNLTELIYFARGVWNYERQVVREKNFRMGNWERETVRLEMEKMQENVRRGNPREKRDSLRGGESPWELQDQV